MTIGITRNGAVLTVELQRPERRNALNTALCTEVREAVEGAEADGTRVVVITGEGTSFCAGADLSGEAIADEFPEALLSMNRALQTVSVPVIAAVNGPAVGAGTQLAIAADLRVVDSGAFFAIPSTRLAIAVDNWTVKRLVSLAGGGPARTVLLGAEQLSAEQALACGLANKLGDLDVAHAWAEEIAQLAPLSLRHLKLVFNDDGTRDEANATQLDAFAAAWASNDAVEARIARKEKRRPVFQGQ
ncbi:MULTISPECIES: enoyl-CoA hydratase [unclassified Rhodococcus (in: high G+C Gram-positive bacteria)]|uniref:enoyl-CoA hydratase n=1 Tax=unclassified Rhodococcus (in: high G+C Gram-positive bacteria) TaxID=192944 RepID=UPI0004897347|nr:MULTISPECIES: enoyl-CoA hydratase [unclassified Rhodococcus (in: high G+C Gram-positive bacteria)]MDQ1181388.1 enoyl-CoA hydratase [Rhodococcus sp. SORGH_AS_0301]MDQ1202746.1 enoyl-CoA hydratase [Rhodococcus sp. SORGH_AS_0303]